MDLKWLILKAGELFKAGEEDDFLSLLASSYSSLDCFRSQISAILLKSRESP